MTEQLQVTLSQLQCELVAERNLVNPDGISWLQYDILSLLKSEAKLPKQLSQHLGITKTKLSKNLTKLHELNYIIQIPAQLDRREMVTDLTIKGRQFLSQTDNKHQELSNEAQTCFTHDEQEQFIKLSQKLVMTLRESRLSSEQ